MRVFLSLSLLLLSGCLGGISETQGGPAAQSAAAGGSGSSGSGGSTGGGPGSPSPPSGPVIPVNPAGIWDMANTVNGRPVTEVALIAAGKYFALASANPFGCADITGGTYTIDGGIYAGSAFTGSGTTLLLNGCTAPHGQSGYLPYTLNGYMLGTALHLSFDLGGILIPTLGATMDKLYSEPSSLATLAGNWDDAGNTLTINADGSFFEQQGSGCVINGAYAMIDPTHNLYAVSFQISNCIQSIAGIAFSGLGYLDDSDPNARHFVEVLSGPDPVNAGSLVLVSANITPQ